MKTQQKKDWVDWIEACHQVSPAAGRLAAEYLFDEAVLPRLTAALRAGGSEYLANQVERVASGYWHPAEPHYQGILRRGDATLNALTGRSPAYSVILTSEWRSVGRRDWDVDILAYTPYGGFSWRSAAIHARLRYHLTASGEWERGPGAAWGYAIAHPETAGVDVFVGTEVVHTAYNLLDGELWRRCASVLAGREQSIWLDGDGVVSTPPVQYVERHHSLRHYGSAGWGPSSPLVVTDDRVVQWAGRDVTSAVVDIAADCSSGDPASLGDAGAIVTDCDGRLVARHVGWLFPDAVVALCRRLRRGELRAFVSHTGAVYGVRDDALVYAGSLEGGAA